MQLSDKQPQAITWAMLLALAVVIVGTLCFFRHNVLYTEGEVLQGVFTVLIVVVAGTVLIGFQCRKTAAWCLILLGGSLLLWQACEARKWTIVHEEVFAILRYAGDTRDETGQSPADLEGYTFNTEWVRPHIYRFEPENQDGFKLIYFMDDPGITYWYSSGSGFGYYPD